jgi:hypothetical protein
MQVEEENKMSKDTFTIDRKLLESLINENIRLKARVEELENKEPLQPQVLENQISIEEYVKILKKERKKNE